MPPAPSYPWAKLSDAELLELRFKDLGLELERSPIAPRVRRLYAELADKGLRFRPHVWLSSEWFSPDGVPGIAVPFYLAHPRLERLERAQMSEVEGGTLTSCMRILRHECGHAIDSAYRLHLRRAWRAAFGRWSTPYAGEYQPRPYSRRFVVHLDKWYAQSHPAEDFAETFAVWLEPRSDWRQRYARWPALKKLEAVEGLMREVAERAPLVRARERTEHQGSLRPTQGEHNAAKQVRYGARSPELLDPLLRRLFPDAPASTGKAERGKSAAAFLRRNRSRLRRGVGRWTGQYQYKVDQVLAGMIARAAELGLRLYRDEGEALADVSVVLAVRTMEHLHAGDFRVMR
jgi:hypothetical protein